MLTLALALFLTGPTEPAEPAPAAEPATQPEAAAEPRPTLPLVASLYAPQEDGNDGQWHGSVNLGATVSTGNAEIITGAASVDGQRRWEDDRVNFSGNWGFSQQDAPGGGSDVTQRYWITRGEYNRFLNDRDYVFGAVRYENDDIADLHLRQTYSAGVGRIFRDEEEFKFEGEAGVSFIDENYVGRADDDEYFAFRLATDLYYRINENMEFLQTAEAYPAVDFSELNGILDSRLRIKMTEAMHAMIQWIAKFNTNAPPNATSTDSLWIFSLGWTY